MEDMVSYLKAAMERAMKIQEVILRAMANFGHRPQDYFLYFHCPLHGGLQVRNHVFHGRPLSPPEMRTDHLLTRPDISCANDRNQPGLVKHECHVLTCAVRAFRISYTPMSALR